MKQRILLFCVGLIASANLSAQYIPPASGGGSGSVTSVAATVPSYMVVSGSPITTSGTLAFSFGSQLQNLMFASPDGSSGVPLFRALVAADIPVLAESKIAGLVSDLAGKQATGNYITALTGDCTATGPGSVPCTLAAVNVSPGSTGDASHTSQITTNGKGLTTSNSSVAIQIAPSQVTGTAVVTTDSRLSDARTPTAHASSHQNGGSDEIATATPAANAIPKAGAGGTLASGWIPTLNQNTTGTASALAANGTNCSAGQIALGIDASGNAEGCYTPTNATVGLGNVTNDAQTKAAIVPNTVPSAGQIHVGNAGGTAFGVVSASGDATIASTGAVTLKNTGSGAGSCTNCSATFDAQGRETAYSSGATPALAATTIGTTSPLGGGGDLSTNRTLTCTTCATTTNGGALSATSPVTISAGGVIACATCATSTGASCSTCTTNALQKGNGANTLQDSGLTETAAGTFRTAAAVPLDLATSVQSSDAATVNTLLTGEMAYSQASTNTTGGSLVLAGGLGTKKFTIVTFGSTGGKTVTLTVNNVGTTLTEGTDWTCVGTSNNTCASNLATAINANGALGSKLTATASSAVVGIDRKAGGNVYALTVATNAGAPLTASNGTDAVTIIGNGLQLGTDPSLGGTFTITAPSKNLTITAGGTTTFSGATIVSGSFAASGSVMGIGGSTAFSADDGGRAAERINVPVSGTSGSNNSAPTSDMIFGAPPSTGTASGSNLRLRTAPSATSTSSTLNTPVDRIWLAAHQVTLTESSATPVVDIPVSSGSVAGGILFYTIRADDATDFQVLRGRVVWSAVNKAGTLTPTLGTPEEITSVSAGTLTDTVTITTGTNLITLNLNAVSSLTQTTLYAFVSGENDGSGNVTTK